jgi:pantoate--beta-alanine ligase
MTTATTIAAVRADLARRRGTGVVGFVPTMGALHDGHVALFRRARAECAVVAASVFVNPLQFNDASDLAAYPRPHARDAEVAAAAGVDVLFRPDVAEMYPSVAATTVEVEGAALGYEGAHRPGHFRGVATVCLKLFHIVEPGVTYFGQKDAQQVAVIEQMVRDLDLGLQVRVVPTVRDPDGLALSSRNARLSPEERRRALAIPRALRAGLSASRQGRDAGAAARAVLGGLDVEYAAVATFGGRPTLVIAARAGATRLIDNVPLDRPELAGALPEA